MIDKIDPEETINTLDSINQASFKSDADRYAAKEAARRLLVRLETPFERGWSLAFETPVLVAGLQMGSDLGIWHKWTEAEKQNNGAPVKLETILSWCNADVEPTLMRESNGVYRNKACLTTDRTFSKAYFCTLPTRRNGRG
jgi:hypothetical protein